MTRTTGNRPSAALRTRHRLRPRLDMLEDRCLLTAPLPGTLDPTFGDGAPVVDFPNATSDRSLPVQAIAIQADGKIVAAGETMDDTTQGLTLTRHNPDGTLDASFGDGGTVLTDIPMMDIQMKIQSDGKIVVAGDTGGFDNFFVARFNSDGALDTAFGNGTGVANIDFGSTRFLLFTMDIQADGKIVVAGDTFPDSGGVAFAMARINSDGSGLDNTFGNAGTVTTAFPAPASDFGSAPNGYALYSTSTTAQAFCMAVDPSTGNIVLGGEATEVGIFDSQSDSSTYEEDIDHAGLAEYNSDGNLVWSSTSPASPVNQALVDREYILGLSIQSDGQIVAAGPARCRMGPALTHSSWIGTARTGVSTAAK